ncbi:unnamed protein product, partial [Symbiodinium microadriaticum]
FLSDVVETGTDKVGSYGNASADAYLLTSWYITDATGKNVLFAYSDPYCSTDYDGSIEECGTCLNDGSYVFRATGICDPTKEDSRWQFCGVTGGAQDQLEFEMINGKCVPGKYGDVDGVCTELTYFPSSPTPSPTGSPTVVPTAFPTGVLVPELECYPVPGPKPIRSNDTCIYVELVDQFGDGWTGNVNFSYWGQIRNDDTNVIMESLDCNCAKMMGCIHPLDLNIDQSFHLTVTAEDENGNEYVPEYAWEIFWTAQIVEDGVFKEKYYGGLTTSMTFEYSRIPETYELVWWENLWKVPETCTTCDGNTSFATYDQFLSDVVGNGTDKVGSYGNASADAYLSTSWYITDMSGKSMLYSYGEPYCDGASGSDVVCGAGCLPDGEYIYRATGICDPDKANVEWEFCGVTGGAQDQLEFEIIDGKCVPVKHGDVDADICSNQQPDVCAYEGTHVRTYICTYVCSDFRAHVCAYESTHVCTHVCTYVCAHESTHS